MERPTTQELMNQLADRLIIDLKEDEILCSTCKGLRFVLTQQGKKSYISSCRDCYSGKHYVCKHCGESHKTNMCDCDGAREEKYDKQEEFELERFNRATKINYKDYDGMFIWNDRAINKEDLEEEIYEIIYDGEEPPKYIYATSKEYINIGVDLHDEISNNCADGYEDMETYLDINSEKLTQAQELIDEWIKEQGDLLYSYTEDYSKVVLLDEIVKEIRKEIKEKVN